MNRDEKPLPTILIHAMITLACCCSGLFPLLPALYLSGVAIYYSGRGLLWWGRRGFPGTRSMFRFGSAFTLASAMAGIPTGMVFSDKLNSTEDQELAEGVGAVSLVILLFVPFWLFAFTIPRRIRSRRQARETAEAIAERTRIETQNAERKSRDQQRRKEARARCELLFNLYKVDIAARFDRGMLDAFLKEYMNDGEPPTVVERRAGELCGILEKHREAVKGTAPTPTTIDQLATWFLDEKKRIESLPLDEELKEEHLAHLNIRYSELSQEILEKMKP